MPENTVAADVAVLKQQQVDISRRIDEGQRATTDALSSISTRIDSLVSLAHDLSALRITGEHNRGQIEEAFAEINVLSDRIENHKTDDIAWHATHMREHADDGRRISRWQGVAIGVSLSIGIASGLAIWGFNLIVNRTQQDVGELKADVRALKDHK